MMSCPYCDSTDVRLKDVLRLTMLDPEYGEDSVVEVRRAVCRECHETFYAYRVYRSDDSYDCVRRDQLEARTGVRIRSGFGKARGWRA